MWIEKRGARPAASLALFFVFAVANAGPRLTPGEVIAKVNAQGAKETVREIWQSQTTAQAFLAGVSSAQKEWLAAAKAIRPGTDAGPAEELNDALAEALLKSPYDLLPWLKHHWWTRRQLLCYFPYDSELPGGVSAYVARLDAALATPPPPNLRSIQQQCLRGIRQTKIDLGTAPR